MDKSNSIDRQIDRLKHYFLTYKQAPEDPRPACELTRVYGREEVYEVIRRSQVDYETRFGAIHRALEQERRA